MSGIVTIQAGAGGLPYIKLESSDYKVTNTSWSNYRVYSPKITYTIGSPAPTTYTITYNKGSYGSGTTIANGTKTSGVNFTLSSSTYTRIGYTQTGWSTIDGGTKAYNLGGTYTANANLTLYPYWTANTYTITYNGLNGATNTNPTSYNIETETITLADPSTRDGYIFAGWKDKDDNTITQIAQGSTGDRTLTATWNTKSSDITLCENCNNNHYNSFKTNYNGETVNVTYPRQFSASKWSTMCLPFNVNYATMRSYGMYGCVYEFKYATGNANVGSGVNLYFSNAKKIEAGKCYIVNANAALTAKTSFVFSGVTIDLSKDNGADLSSPATPEASVAAYNALPGYKSEGTIELVGTLRNGILMG
ncbi:MAG: InlB B-repeat-containing protein, partial [Paludibacteraceae bacterium]|nr:InlB B-repeat-containing protein [Paludibacteraceae bacterium]